MGLVCKSTVHARRRAHCRHTTAHALPPRILLHTVAHHRARVAAAQVSCTVELCRRYNKAAMGLLEARAYKQAKELIEKAEVRVCGGIGRYAHIRAALRGVGRGNRAYQQAKLIEKAEVRMRVCSVHSAHACVAAWERGPAAAALDEARALFGLQCWDAALGCVRDAEC